MVPWYLDLLVRLYPRRFRERWGTEMRDVLAEKLAAARAGGFANIVSGGTAESFKAVNPEAWGKLSAKQQKKLESGVSTVTEWPKFSELMLLPKDKLAAVDPTDHFSELAPAERGKLITAVKTAKGDDSRKADAQVGRSRSAQNEKPGGPSPRRVGGDSPEQREA